MTRPLLLVVAVAGCAAPASVTVETTATDQAVLFQAVSAVNADVVWISGHRASYARTVDGGATWITGVVPGPDTLQFRDIHAVSADTAYLLAAGPADMSRIYRTDDGGQTWRLQWTNPDPDGFWDCFDFWNATTGLAFGDAVNGRITVLRTTDGETWTRIPEAALPPAAGSEGGFAASGTCLTVRGASDAWIGTGAGDAARIYHTPDRGDTWTVTETPMVQDQPASGITTIAWWSDTDGISLGGVIGNNEITSENAMITTDAGMSWTSVTPTPFPGPVYGAATVAGDSAAAVAVGPRGIALTEDRGVTWTVLDTLSHWAVGFGGRTGWSVGPEGRITTIRVP